MLCTATITIDKFFHKLRKALVCVIQVDKARQESARQKTNKNISFLFI